MRFNGGWFDTAIFDRASLGRGATLAGPAIVEQPDTTVVIDPGATAIVDGSGQSGDFGRCGMTLDPVTLAVIQNGLRQVASEMDLVHEKTSFSPVISEGFDRSNGIYDRTTGEVVAQGELGLPIFVGVMQFTDPGRHRAAPRPRTG